MNKIAVSDAARARYEAMARKVWEENGKGTYGQDMDAVTKVRLLREIDPRMTTKKFDKRGELTDEAYAMLVQLNKLGSNAHAINVSLNELGGTKKSPLSTDYSALG